MSKSKDGKAERHQARDLTPMPPRKASRLTRAALLAGTALCAPWAAAVALSVPTLFLQTHSALATPVSFGNPGSGGVGGTGGTAEHAPTPGVGDGGKGGDASPTGDGGAGVPGSVVIDNGGRGGTDVSPAEGGAAEGGGGAGYSNPGGEDLGGGGGGGGGGRGDTVDGGTISVAVFGGQGGAGEDSGTNPLDSGGGGGGGGIGVVWTSLSTLTVEATVTGGDGGAGGDGNGTDLDNAIGGGGGDGGAGIAVTGAGGTINISAAVTGGDGGAAGEVDIDHNACCAYDGFGGYGVVGANLNVVNDSTITGGMGASRENASLPPVQAAAIDFTSGTNSLTGTGSLSGAARVESGATLNIDASTLNFSSGIDVEVRGTLHLSGAITTGDIAQITALGTVIDYADGSTSAAPILLTDDGTQLQVTTGSAEQSGIISEDADPHPIEKIGAGTLTLSGANTYSGGTKITAGTLAVSNDGKLGGTDGNIVLNGGTLEATDTFSSARDINVAAASGIEVDDTKTLTLSGQFSGSAQTAKSGDGTLALGGDNSGYTGGFKVDAGTLQIGAANNLGGPLTLSGGTLGVTNDVTLTNTIAVDADNGSIDVASGKTLNANGAFSGSGQTAITGPGDVVLGANNSSYGGGFKVNDGTLSASNANNLGSGTLVLSGGTFAATDTFTFTHGVTVDADDGTIDVADTKTMTLSGVLTAADGDTLTKTGDGTLALNHDNTSTFSGTINLEGGTLYLQNSGGAGGANGHINASDPIILYANGVNSATPITLMANDVQLEVDGTDSAEQSGNIDETGGPRPLEKIGTGTLVLSGNNSYTGLTTVSAGALNIQSNTGLGTNAAGTTVANNAALELEGGVTVSGETLTLNGDGTGTNTGALRNISGDNTWTGTITLASASVINSDAGTLTLSAINNAGFALTLGGAGDGEVGGVLSGSGTVTKNGASTWTLSGNNTYTGVTNVNAGILNIQSNNALGTTAGNTVVASGATLQVEGGITSPEAITISGTGVSGAGAIENVTDDNTLSGVVTLAADASIISDDGSLTLSGGITGGSNDLTLGGAGDGEVSGNIAAITSLTKSGAGTWTLSGTNTTGNVSITGGELAVENGAAIDDTANVNVSNVAGAELHVVDSETIGSLSGGGGTGGSVVIDSGETLTTGDATSTAFAGIISGAGSLTKQGTGTFTLTGNNSFTGATTINNGKLALSGSGDIAESSQVNVANAAGTFDISQVTGSSASITTLNGVTGSHVDLGSKTLNITNGSTTYAGIIEDGGIGGGTGGGVTVSGGLQVLSGDSTFTGPLAVTNGQLNLNATGSTATNTVNVSGGGTLLLQNNTDANGALSDTATVNVNGNGTLELQANETIGHLAGSSSTALVSLDSALANLTTGDGTDSIYAGTIFGTGGLIKQGSDTFTLTGNSTSFSGTTHITAGTLRLSGAGSLGTSDVTVDAGTTFDVAPASAPMVGSLTNNGTTNLQDGAANDVLTIADGYGATNGTVNLDIMMDGTGVDHIVANSYSGNTTFAFTQQGAQQVWGGDQKIVDTSTALAGTYAQTGLASSGLFSYSLVDDGQDIYVHQNVNVGALGGLASNITLVQSIIGAVVNRPSSPFVGGLAASVPPGYCGAGPWVRGTGGFANADGEVASADGAFTGSSNVGLNYVGGQFGLDLSCFNVQGIDVAYGIIGGYNAGSTSQQINGPAPSTTDATFTQEFGGIYATVNKGNFSADIQAREDLTDFAFTNASIGLDNAPVHTDRLSLSGSASYSLPAGDFRLVPTAGFSVAKNESSSVSFVTGENLAPDTSFNYIGFAGITLSKPTVLPDKLHAIIPFGTLTAYNDFAPDPTSVFTDTSGGQLQLISNNLGFYTEVSAGLSFVSLLDDSKGGPKQFNASVRADARFSDTMNGFGVTAQARAQF